MPATASIECQYCLVFLHLMQMYQYANSLNVIDLQHDAVQDHEIQNGYEFEILHYRMHGLLHNGDK